MTKDRYHFQREMTRQRTLKVGVHGVPRVCVDPGAQLLFLGLVCYLAVFSWIS